MSDKIKEILLQIEKVKEWEQKDPQFCLNQARQTAEHICIYLIRTRDLLASDKKMPEGLDKLKNKLKNHIPREIYNHLSTIQLYGNQASHFQEDRSSIHTSTAGACLTLLSQLVQWFIEQLPDTEQKLGSMSFWDSPPIEIQIHDGQVPKAKEIALSIVNVFQRANKAPVLTVVNQETQQWMQYLLLKQDDPTLFEEMVSVQATILKRRQFEDGIVEGIQTFLAEFHNMGFGEIQTSLRSVPYIQWFIEGLIAYKFASPINPKGTGYDIYAQKYRGVSMQIPDDVHPEFLKAINVRSGYETTIIGGVPLLSVPKPMLLKYVLPPMVCDYIRQGYPSSYFSFQQWKLGLK